MAVGIYISSMGNSISKIQNKDLLVKYDPCV